MTTSSCIYEGHVRHRRFAPVTNTFRYGLYMMYLDLQELPKLFEGRLLWSMERANLASFRRSDYFGPADQPLDEAVRTAVEQRTGVRPNGPIRMLTHLRYFGFLFNPVTFYHCFDESGTRVETLVAQITNTPWRQRHTYILNRDSNLAEPPRMRFCFDKEFHISPFNPMDLRYDWRFSPPGERFTVYMACLRQKQKVLDATLDLRRRPLSRETLTAVLWRHPVMTWKVIGMIHWQALRLWIKRAPYYPNPSPPAGGGR